MAEDPRPNFVPTWPVCVEADCKGIQQVGHDRCLAHGRDLSGFVPGAELDLRGVAVDTALLIDVLELLRDPVSHWRKIGRVWCEHTWFQDDAWFNHCWFSGPASFDKAHFSGIASFEAVVCEDALEMMETRFASRVLMVPVTTAPRMDLRFASFAVPVEINARTHDFDCVGARFEGGVTLRTTGRVDASGAYFGDPSTIAGARLVSLTGVDVSGLVLTEVDLSDCRFLDAYRLEQLRIEGVTRFATPGTWWRARRRMLADERTGSPSRVAALYRSLRKSFEDSKNEAGAGDFYYGEMEARRHVKESSIAERAILTVYWLFSGYGQRASRALAALVVAMAVVTTVLVSTGQDFGLAARIALGTALSKDPAADLTAAGEWTVLIARFLGPVLLALAVLAIRARVKR